MVLRLDYFYGIKNEKNWSFSASSFAPFKRWSLYQQLNHPISSWLVRRGCNTHTCRIARCIFGTKAAEIEFHSVIAVKLWQAFHVLIDLIMWMFSRWLSWYIMCRQTLCYLSQSTTGLLIWCSQSDPLHVGLGASRPAICAPCLVLTSLLIFWYSHHQTITNVNLRMHICLGQSLKYSSTMPKFWCAKFDCYKK